MQYDRFEVISVMPENRRGNNLYWIKDTVTSYGVYVRKVSGKYHFVGIIEEERKVLEYECEEFFYEDDTYSGALLRFYVRVVQSTLRLRGEVGV